MSATFNQASSRPEPKMPTQNYKTYAVHSPLATHFRKATCAEIDCPAYLRGWNFRIETLPPELLHLALNSGREYKRVEIAEGETYLFFAPGQPCFESKTHVKSVERPEFFYVGRGDHRSFSPRRATQFDRPDQFVESFEDHLARIRREIEKG